LASARSKSPSSTRSARLVAAQETENLVAGGEPVVRRDAEVGVAGLEEEIPLLPVAVVLQVDVERVGSADGVGAGQGRG